MTAHRQRRHALAVFVDVQNQRADNTAAGIPANSAAINAMTPPGAIPAKVSEIEGAMATAGFANEVDAVNQ